MKTSPRNIIRILPTLAITCAIALMGVASSVNAQGMNDIQWLTNVEQAKQMAAEQNKLVLLHFHANWSRPSKTLDTYVFRSATVQKAIAENVVPVKIDADRALNLVNEYNVAMVPFDIIISPAGRVVTERRSPADAGNYAKMISGTTTASRMLGKETRGPIAHQHEVVKNRSIKGQNPTDFRVDGPSVQEVGLSKDGDILQRRQAAFSNSNNSVKKTNPFVRQSSYEKPGLASMSSEPATVQDLERDKFLSRERDWVAPSNETRRAKPQRIVNDRYFESIAKKTPVQVASTSSAKPASFSLPSNSREVTLDSDSGFDLQLDSATASSNEFKVQPTVQSAEKAPAANVGLTDLNPHTPLLDRHKVSLKGKCPVTLITEGRWINGDSQFGIVHRNRTYIFASAEKISLASR